MPIPLPDDSIHPRDFSADAARSDRRPADPLIELLARFFLAKPLDALKAEDRAELFYDDWLAYQAKHQIYARLLAPKALSSTGGSFDLLRLTRFLEVFGYFSAAHGYSLQVSFLGLFPILMSGNEPLKREAVAALEAGGLFALGVSEKEHGSDLLGNEFAIVPGASGGFVANGRKYYIGNSNRAAMISTLARVVDPSAAASRRTPFAMIALRPPAHPDSFIVNRKIHTLGVRSAFVGDFAVKDYPLPESDVISRGRQAWDAVLGTVTLGKFFLGFGSIGICERALRETLEHLRARILFGKSAMEMPHIRAAVSHAYARLTAMKLYAYRALDYLHSAAENDRRYLLYAAVQKAGVGTQGVKVMALLSECMGARGFESDTFFEMALRDAQLIPGLEGSTHINLALAVDFIPRFFQINPRRGVRSAGVAPSAGGIVPPPSLLNGDIASVENPYLFLARARGANTVAFGDPLAAFTPLAGLANIRRFVAQARAFGRFAAGDRCQRLLDSGSQAIQAAGQAFASIAYGQLIAENAVLLRVDRRMVSIIFHLLVEDLTLAGMRLIELPAAHIGRAILKGMIRVPRSSAAEWNAVHQRAV